LKVASQQTFDVVLMLYRRQILTLQQRWFLVWYEIF